MLQNKLSVSVPDVPSALCARYLKPAQTFSVSLGWLAPANDIFLATVVPSADKYMYVVVVQKKETYSDFLLSI